MSGYSTKLNFAILDGINLTGFADVMAEHSRDNDYIEPYKGLNGDAVTHFKYDTMDRFRVTQIATSPHWSMIENYAKNHKAFVFQFSDTNTGETKTSNVSYIQSIGTITDGQPREFTIYCEEVK